MLTPIIPTAGCSRRSLSRQNGRTVSWFGLLPILFPGILSEGGEDTEAVTALIRSCFLHYSHAILIFGFERTVSVALRLSLDPNSDADH